MKDDQFKLQNDGQDGLRFVSEASNSSELGVYEMQSPNQTAEDTRNQNGSANDAAPVAAPTSASSESDIYGVTEPTPEPQTTSESTSYRSEQRETKKSKRNKKKSKRYQEEDEQDNAVSLSELYERRQRENLQLNKGSQKGERRELPARPFWDAIFQPFFAPGFMARVAMITGAAFIPLLATTLFFSRALSHNVEEMLNAQKDLDAILAFFTCIWRDKVIFLTFCFLWGVFSIPMSIHVFVETANGADKIDEWPEYNFMAGLGQFLWLITLIGLAGIPGAALFSIFGLNTVVGFTFSATIFTPIFFLSCMQTDALFTLITKDIFRSLKRCRRSWMIFTGISFAFLFGTVGLSLAAIGYAVDPSAVNAAEYSVDFTRSFIVALVVALSFSAIPILYLRFLGRLAWIIEDDVRKNQPLEEDEEEEEYEDENLELVD